MIAFSSISLSILFMAMKLYGICYIARLIEQNIWKHKVVSYWVSTFLIQPKAYLLMPKLSAGYFAIKSSLAPPFLRVQ